MRAAGARFVSLPGGTAGGRWFGGPGGHLPTLGRGEGAMSQPQRWSEHALSHSLVDLVALRDQVQPLFSA